MNRVDEFARRWRVTIDRRTNTGWAWLAFGTRGADHVVLKVQHEIDDEWASGSVLSSLGSNACVRVHECEPGAVLMEHAIPGVPLERVTTDADDDRALAIIADVIMRYDDSPTTPAGSARIADFLTAFDGDAARAIPTRLLQSARHTFETLLATGARQRLLHGDLHHGNVLDAGVRGWLAVDPKGVIGEREYEIGAALRNPIACSDLFGSTAVVEHRLRCLTRGLDADPTRAAQWAFVNSVLSAIWLIEDGQALDGRHASLMVANALALILGI